MHTLPNITITNRDAARLETLLEGLPSGSFAGLMALEEELFPSLTSDVTVKQSDKDRRKWPQQTRPMVRFSQQLKNIERRKIDTVTNQEGFVGGIRMCRAANKKINKVVDSD